MAIIQYLIVIPTLILAAKPGQLLEIVIICVICILSNIYCARYLYRKVSTNSLEWALFALIGNFNAIFAYWLWDSAIKRWREGKRFFS